MSGALSPTLGVSAAVRRAAASRATAKRTEGQRCVFIARVFPIGLSRPFLPIAYHGVGVKLVVVGVEIRAVECTALQTLRSLGYEGVNLHIVKCAETGIRSAI